MHHVQPPPLPAIFKPNGIPSVIMFILLAGFFIGMGLRHYQDNAQNRLIVLMMLGGITLCGLFYLYRYRHMAPNFIIDTDGLYMKGWPFIPWKNVASVELKRRSDYFFDGSGAFVNERPELVNKIAKIINGFDYFDQITRGIRGAKMKIYLKNDQTYYDAFKTSSARASAQLNKKIHGTPAILYCRNVNAKPEELVQWLNYYKNKYGSTQ